MIYSVKNLFDKKIYHIFTLNYKKQFFITFSPAIRNYLKTLIASGKHSTYIL